MGCETGNRLRRAWKCLQCKTMVGVSLAGSVVSLGRWFGVVEQGARAGRGLTQQGAAAAVIAGCGRANSQGSCWERSTTRFARFLAEHCLLFAPPLVTLAQLGGVLWGHLWPCPSVLVPRGLEAAMLLTWRHRALCHPVYPLIFLPPTPPRQAAQGISGHVGDRYSSDMGFGVNWELRGLCRRPWSLQRGICTCVVPGSGREGLRLVPCFDPLEVLLFLGPQSTS